jgi:hypothetical protein
MPFSNFSKRISIDELLEHPFFHLADDADSIEPLFISKLNITHNIEHISAVSWKVHVFPLIESFILSDS